MDEARIIPTALLIAAGQAAERLINNDGFTVLGGVFGERRFELSCVAGDRHVTVSGTIFDLPDGELGVSYSYEWEAPPRRPRLRLLRNKEESLRRRRTPRVR